MITLGLKAKMPIGMLEAAHPHCIENADEVRRSRMCGCFYCGSIFPASESEFFGNDISIDCPRCGLDCVLGDASGFPITRDFLERMHARWF